MKSTTKKINALAENPWLIIISGLSSIIGFMWFLHDKFDKSPVLVPGVLFGVAFIILSAGFIYSLRVRTENIALRSLSEIFFEINQIYRDKLRELFYSDQDREPITDQEVLIAEEERVLKGICQRIDSIFSRVLGRKCMVTLKLVTIEDGKVFAHTYVRSQEMCPRDKPDRPKYIVGTGENTGFDEALANRPDGLPKHFFSSDLLALEKEKGYANQRQHYYRHYKSTLVVPIKGNSHDKDANPNEFDLIGFLCVDTLSTNRLNNGYHLYMLSALANQMYNFMSLMRGKYTVFVGY